MIHPSLDEKLKDLPIATYEQLMQYIKMLEDDCRYSEERVKSMREASKYQTIVVDTPKKLKSLYDRRTEIRLELVEKLLEVARNTSRQELIVDASDCINKLLEGK